MGKYLSSHGESELLPNLLKLEEKKDIEQSEFEVFFISRTNID
jgi:hypothetical protein